MKRKKRNGWALRSNKKKQAASREESLQKYFFPKKTTPIWKIRHSCRAARIIYLNLQFTLRWIILLFAGGTSFFAMHIYAPICRLSMFKRLSSSPSMVSLRRVLLLNFVIIWFPSSRRQMIPAKYASACKCY